MNEKKNSFLVRTFCATYNHEHYVTDALNGFVLQTTTFPVVYTIVDDASSDNTPNVIRRFVGECFDLDNAAFGYDRDTDYGHVTFAQHKTNKNCYFVVVYLKENHYSQKKSKAPYLKEWNDTKYIALCEGDDYWTDPLKLQKQVDFLERHEEYSMCFHAAEVKHVGGADDPYRNGTHFLDLEDREYTSTELVSKWMVPTASIVYKRDLVENYQIKHPEWLVYGDIMLALKCSHLGKIFGMSDVMSVYRIQPTSVTNNVEFVDRTVFKLPDHYRCLRMNFPKVEKGPLEWSISHSYYVRMKRQPNVLLKLRDFILFVWWDPKQAFERVRRVVVSRM